MRESVINKVPGEKMIVVRESFVALCDGNACAAAILNHLVYWHDVKVANAQQAKVANRIAELHGDEPTQSEDVLQWHTSKELHQAMLGAWGLGKVQAALRLIEDLGFITVQGNPNPRYNFDKTKYLRLQVDYLNHALGTLDLANRGLNPNHRASDSSHRASDPSYGASDSIHHTKTTSKISSETSSNSRGDLTRTEEQDHHDDFFAEQSQPIPQAPLPQAPLAPKPEPQIIPSVNSIQDLQGQGEAPPVPPPPPKVPPRNPSLAPNPNARVGNGTPWAPLAPWTSREEYDAFKAWLVAANPGKPEGYIHAILIRVEKGDFDNRSWQGFKAGSSPDNTPAGTNTPKEWQDAVQAIFEGLGSNPFYATREADRWAESYQQFRRLYSYDSKGQPVRWPAADSWALAQAKAILAAAYPAAS